MTEDTKNPVSPPIRIYDETHVLDMSGAASFGEILKCLNLKNSPNVPEVRLELSMPRDKIRILQTYFMYVWILNLIVC